MDWNPFQISFFPCNAHSQLDVKALRERVFSVPQTARLFPCWTSYGLYHSNTKLLKTWTMCLPLSYLISQWSPLGWSAGCWSRLVPNGTCENRSLCPGWQPAQMVQRPRCALWQARKVRPRKQDACREPLTTCGGNADKAHSLSPPRGPGRHRAGLGRLQLARQLPCRSGHLQAMWLSQSVKGVLDQSL